MYNITTQKTYVADLDLQKKGNMYVKVLLWRNKNKLNGRNKQGMGHSGETTDVE